MPLNLRFSRVGHFGLPFHGLVRNNKLQLPDGSLKNYTYVGGYVGGEALAVAGSGASVHARSPEEIAEDTAKGHNWKPYALLSGSERNIGGKDLGSYAWLYHDGTVTWKIRAEIVRPAIDDITIKVWLSSLFGFFSADQDVQMASERLLASIAYEPLEVLSYDSDAGEAVYSVVYQNRTADLFCAPDRNGSNCLISVGFHVSGLIYSYSNVPLGNSLAHAAYEGNSQFGDWTYAVDQEAVYTSLPLNSGLSGVLKAVITGTGSLLPPNVGDGISASLTLHKDMRDLYVVSFTPALGAGRRPFYPPARDECGILNGTTTVETERFLFGYDANDNEVSATSTYTIDMVYTDPSDDCTNREIAATSTLRYEYAGQILEYEYTSTGVQTTWPIDSGYVPQSYTWNGQTTTTAPSHWCAAALGDRTVLFAEFCWDNATLYSHYVSPGGTLYNHETAVSALGATVPFPSIVKLHGFVSNHPVDDQIAYAGAWPYQCCYV